jgi:hypothetical protein
MRDDAKGATSCSITAASWLLVQMGNVAVAHHPFLRLYKVLKLLSLALLESQRSRMTWGEYSPVLGVALVASPRPLVAADNLPR